MWQGRGDGNAPSPMPGDRSVPVAIRVTMDMPQDRRRPPFGMRNKVLVSMLFVCEVGVVMVVMCVDGVVMVVVVISDR